MAEDSFHFEIPLFKFTLKNFLLENYFTIVHPFMVKSCSKTLLILFTFSG